jgi:tetratricopeptide (TPR) repeat protein
MTAFRLAAVALLSLAGTMPAAEQPRKASPPMPAKLPLCGLAPSKLIPNLCLLEYHVSTASPECQAFVNQGLGYYYSYVWMEAARSFETATVRDPNCALAWWQLSRALEKWGRNDQATKALLKADALKAHASHREQQLILARMQEKGQAPGVGDAETRKKAAINTIDTLLSLHDDDEEAWYYRAHLAGGYGFGGTVGAVPFYKALCRVNPLHPGANHELVHFYENVRRPALGWVHAENYIKSSPGIPHPFHMQAHLATRLGRWDKTSDRSARAVELERAYHKEMNVKPQEDHQYSHHLEILTISLVHDGRFAEARAIQEEARRCGYHFWLPWFRLHVGERNWPDALKMIDRYKKDKTMASYLRAVLYLRQGDVSRAAPEIEVLRQAYQKRKNDRKLELRLWETQGLLLCMTGAADAGVKLLERAVKKTKDDYSHHAWGNGAYYMEAWGTGALLGGKLDVAEEAFLEALAHDTGSVRGALGLQVLCERQGRFDEAQRYAALAHKFWRHAARQHFDAELAYLRQTFPHGTPTTQPEKTGATALTPATPAKK